ncbi:MAG: helix-turn-helix transcriptional regulator [Ruminococcus sp.]|nr:helix-turn-helix transcriptional regulator [Ruminococcus sp.]
MAFSDKLRFKRNELRISQDELAGRLGVSRQSISKWESGAAYPEIDKLISISNFFDVSIDYLLKDNYFPENIGDENMDRAVIRFLVSSNDMEQISQKLISIAKDGRIDDEEIPEMEMIIAKLDTVKENINKVQSLIGKEQHHADNQK